MLLRSIAIVCFAAGLLAAQKEATLEVKAIRHWSLSGETRVAVEVSGEFEFASDRLHNPERVYFDIKSARPNLAGKRHTLHEVSDPYVKQVRVAETQPGTTRIVFDLTGEVDVKASQLSNPSRLMVEVRTKGAARRGGGIENPAQAESLPYNSAAPERPVGVTVGRTVELPSPKPPTPAVTAARPPTTVESNPLPGSAAVVNPEKVSPPANLEPASKAARNANSLIRALGLKVTRVVLDAGHGGHDQGTAGPRGLTEKELVLDVTLRLGKLIERQMGSEVIYTRSDDTFIPLEQRTRIAMERKADLFLSIHANSSPFPRVGGVESYYLNFTDSKEALSVAARENAASQKSVYELRDLIQKITLHEKIEESREFANRMQSVLFPFALRYNPAIKNRGVKKAPFVVLIGAEMPSVLVEIGFVSNVKEEALLKKTDHRQKLAEALYKGVEKYALSLSHFQVAKAE